MGNAESLDGVRRTWSVAVRMHQAGPLLECEECGLLSQPPEEFPLIRSSVLAHLARHARREQLALHLRTCRCGQAGCQWHPRHRGCAGPVGLALTRVAGGRIWRLADACLACVGATDHAAVVPEPSHQAARPAAAEDSPGASDFPTSTAEGSPAGYLFEAPPWWDEQTTEHTPRS